MSIYFDNSATTKICREALLKYNEVSEAEYGNPSSLHTMGVYAQRILDDARRSILTTLGDKQSHIVFTSSGTEANNLAIIGRAHSKERYKRGARIITTDSEHASVSEPLLKLEGEGFEIIRIPTKGGKVDTDALKAALCDKVILVSMMMVNNETGARYNIEEVSKLVKASCPDAYVHVDATQSYLKLPFTKKSIGADMITVSSHKIEGPKGMGALIIDPAVIRAKGLSPIVFGGGQEGGLRSGTENVPAVAAFAEAAKIAFADLDKRFEKTSALRRLLIEKLASDDAFSSITLTLPECSAPHILNITLPGIKSETMLHYLSSLGILVSSGSACSSNSSHVSSALMAYGRTKDEADSSIRISFSHRNSEDEVLEFCKALRGGLARLARVRR